MGEPVIGTEIAEEGVSIVALHEHDLSLSIQLRVGLGGRIVRDTRLQGHLGTQVPGVRVGLGTPRPDVLKSIPSVAGWADARAWLPRVLRSHRRRQGASGPRAPPGSDPSDERSFHSVPFYGESTTHDKSI